MCTVPGMLSEAFLWGSQCFNQVYKTLAAVSCFRQYTTGLKLLFESTFQVVIFHCSLVSCILWILRQEVLRNCCQCWCLTVYGKTLQEGGYASMDKAPAFTFSKNYGGFSTCQGTSTKMTREYVVLRVSKCFIGFSSLGNTWELQTTLFFLEFPRIWWSYAGWHQLIIYHFPCEINLSMI